MDEQFTGLLKAFAEAIRPHLGLDDFNPNDIEGLITEAIDGLDLYDAISDAVSMNSNIPSVDEMNYAIQDSLDEADFIRPEDFDPSAYYIVTHDELDEEVTRAVETTLDTILTTEFIINKLVGEGYEVVARAEAA
tara:strand:+ start:299 stop:703 length:405 start_codon:yes stop_codon:yes gene_type:complete